MPSKLPPNPYIINKPIDNKAGFFGRKEILQEVEETLRYPNRTSVILHGQRHIGKTSLLLALERALPAPPFFPVYFNLAGKGLVPAGQVLHEMAVAAAQKAEMPPPPPDDFDESPNAFHEKFLPDLYQAIGSNLRPIFLLDEFEAITTPEEKLPQHAAARVLDEYLYSLITTQTYTDFVFAAGRRMTELTKVTESSFKADLTRFVSVLNPEQARALIVQDGVKGIPQYEEAAIQRILTLTRGHPYLTQLVCHHLYNRAYERSKRKPRVTADDVEAILPALLDAEDTAMPQIWESIPPLESIMLAVVAERLTDADDMINDAVITTSLSQAGISPYTTGMYAAPENLVNWQVLEQTGNSYNFHVDFFRLWIAKNRPVEQVKQEELGLLDPRANALYKEAVADHEAGNDDAAVDKLYQALKLNPNHLPARMLLASILQDRGQTNDAINQYEKAYKLDPAAVAGLLTAALFLLGAAYDKVRNFADSIKTYKRILEITPNDNRAKEKLAAAQTTLQQQEADRQQTVQTYREEKKDRRWLWVVFLLLAILLPLLCLAALWGFDRQQPTAADSAATQTAEAQQNAQAATATAQAIAGANGGTGSGTEGEGDGSGTGAGDGSGAGAGSGTGGTSGQGTGTESGQSGQGAEAGADGGSSGTGEGDSSGAGTGSETGNGDTSGQGAGAESGQGQGTEAGTDGTEANGNGQPSNQILVDGTDTMQPLIKELAAAYTTQNPDVEVVIQNNGSAAGIEAVKNGTANAGTAARPLDPTETAGAQVIPIAENDPIAVIVHPLTPVDNLTTQQLQEIFAGQITNWSEVGGPDAPIVVVSSLDGSDTRTVFEKTVLGQAGIIAGSGVAIEVGSDQAVRDIVASRPNAIGFTGQKYAITSPDIPEESTEPWPVLDISLLEVKVLTLDGMEPSPENAASGAYPASRPLNMVVPESPDSTTQGWIDFIRSPKGQQIIQDSGYSPAP